MFLLRFRIPKENERIGRSSLSLHKFKELFRYLRITASTDVDPVALPLLPLLLPSLSSAIIRGPGELAVATIGVAHGGLAIRNRAGLFSQSHCLPHLLSSKHRKTDPRRQSINLAWKNKQTTLFNRLVITKLCGILPYEGTILIFGKETGKLLLKAYFKKLEDTRVVR